MSKSIGPSILPPSTTAERAKIIVERALRDTAKDVESIGEKSPAGQKSLPDQIKVKAEALPPELRNLTTAQIIEGRVQAVREGYIEISTAAGIVKVQIPPDIQIIPGQSVTIEIPPHARAGQPVTLSYHRISSEIELPAIPFSQVTRDYPAVKIQDRLIATPQPITQYSYAVPLSASFALKSKFIPAVLAIKIENMASHLSLKENFIPPNELPARPLPISKSDMPVFTPDALDNVLTQAPPAQSFPKTVSHKTDTIFPAMITPVILQSFSESLLSTSSEIKQNIFAFSAQNQTSQILRSFKELTVLATIPAQTPKTKTEEIVAKALPPKHTETTSLATVIGATKGGQTIISVPPPLDKAHGETQLFYIQSQIFAPVGSQILVTMTERSLGAVAASPELMAGLPASLQTRLSALFQTTESFLPAPFQPGLSQGWPALEESLLILGQNAPAAAQNLQNTLPSPSPRMVSTALFFVAALKLGNLETWLGEKNLDAIKQYGKKGLIERLTGDFGRLSAQATETTAGQWKTLSLPMLFDGGISNIQLHIRSDDRREETDEKDDDKIAKTRFVVDLSLSHMGAMQIDGFLTPKSLDMILRSHTPLDETPRRDLMRIFATTIEALGFQGGISFQTAPESWVKIQPRSKSY